MTSTATAFMFASEVTTADAAITQAQLLITALQHGDVEDTTGRSVGFAQDTIYRFLVHRPRVALDRDHDLTLATLKTLGSVRGYRIATACAEHSDQAGASLYWEKVADQLFTEAQAPIAA